jgi:membrane-bound metal-dependent hydrolase YbcI (DUF457 family)
MAKTHSLIGGTTGFVVSTAALPALGAPSYLDAAIVASAVALATASSSLPDSLEKWLHVKHRTVTHWPALQLFVLGVITASALLASKGQIGFYILAVTSPIALGCVMHSVADAMTIDPRGIQLLWPISRRGFHLTPRWARVRVATESRSEWVFGIVWCLIVLIYTYARFRHSIPA